MENVGKPTVREIINPATLEAVGKFRRTHALRGELNAELDDTLSEEQLQELEFVIVEIDGIPTPFRIESIRPKGVTTILIKLAGIDSADTASSLVNHPIYVDAQALEGWPLAMQDEEDTDGVYAADLAGYRAVDTHAQSLGVVDSVDVSTANPLLVLLTDAGQTVLIPVNGPFITHIDPLKQIVTIDAPDALLGLNKRTL